MKNQSTNALIKLSNVSQQFAVGSDMISVLKDVTFSIREQTFTVIYGQSGSGKSTLLNILSGLQRPTKGSVSFDGRDVYKLSPHELAYLRANRIGIVYQQNFWVKSLNVVENVAIPLFLQGLSMRKATSLAQSALEKINMGDYGKKSPLVLSGGEQQRVAIARAIVNDPMFIIADEPTGNLDSTNGDSIMDLLVSFQKDRGRTIILVTHNMEYLTLADHLLNIQDGVVRDLQDEDITKTTEALLSDVRKRITQFASHKKGGHQSNA